MKRETRHDVRGPLAGLLAVALLATLALADSAAAPASGAAVKVVTLKLGNRGTGTWSTAGDTEKGSETLSYRWSGTVKIKVPTAQLRPGAVLNAGGTGTLTGSWTGDYRGTKFQAPFQGPYHCTYKASNVAVHIAAFLRNGPSRKTLALWLNRGVGFFPGSGDGAEANCSNDVGKDGPPHFEPSWLFRDAVTDHFRLTSNTAVLVLPRTLLSSGQAVTSRFPNEVGQSGGGESLRAQVTWHNVGRLTAKKS